MTARVALCWLVAAGSWLGEFYPCKPDIFEVTYEVVEDGDR